MERLLEAMVELGWCWAKLLEVQRCSRSNPEERSWPGERRRLQVVTGEEDCCAGVPAGCGCCGEVRRLRVGAAEVPVARAARRGLRSRQSTSAKITAKSDEATGGGSCCCC